MKVVMQFVRTTLVGGLLFLVPLILIIVLMGKAFGVVSKLMHPIVERLPEGPFSGPGLAYILSVLALVLIGFLAGLVAKTGFGASLAERIESLILGKVPGFTLLKSMAQGSLGTPSEQPVQVAFANLDDAWALAFIIEQNPDGLLTVFVPSAPTPTAGSLYFLREDQVKRVNLPVKDAIQCLMRLGVGSRSLLAQARLSAEVRS